jgi:hypothetical protein
MAGDVSAYAALGLSPDADSASVEQAYRRLIKEHHPDRAGGDARRAAEINRAYRELRTRNAQMDPLDLVDEDLPPARRGRSWTAFALVAAVSVLGLTLTGRLGSIHSLLVAGTERLSTAPVPRTASEPMNQPLNVAAIEGSVRRALQLARTSDEMGLANASDDCHRELRQEPSVLLLDRCAAFDDAVVQLQDRDPLRDQGPFSELAVTGRQLSGAGTLSQDSVAIDSRLDRIRLRAEITLAPILDQAKPPTAATTN